MSAQNYPITFRYGATTPPYSKAKPHRGNDRACPVGTPVVISGVTIGLTGKTGFATGPHLHTQAGTDKACQKTFNPAPLEFQPGVVVNAGTGRTWGKFVTIQVGSKFITYCHLSKISVNIGRVLASPHRYANLVGKIVQLQTPYSVYQEGTDIRCRHKASGAYVIRGTSSRHNRVLIFSGANGGIVSLPLADASGRQYSDWKIL